MKRAYLLAALAIAGKDLRAELRSRELLSMMAIFALLSILVFSFALELDRLAREEAVSGVLWVTLIFTSLLGLNRSLAQEVDQGNLDALLLAPVSRSAIFLGKFAANFLFTGLVGAMLLPLMSALYGMNMLDGRLIITTAVGIFGFCAVGTLLATMTAQTRSREALLPIAMLPLALPFLLTAVRASKGILNANAEWQLWFQLLAAIAIIYFTLSLLLYGAIVED